MSITQLTQSFVCLTLILRQEVVFDDVLGVQLHDRAVEAQRAASGEALGAKHVELVKLPVAVEVHRAALAQFTLYENKTADLSLRNHMTKN
jgi:hypothetical protein